jgi:aspartate carbamoyltransferase catalytic subunit
MMNPARGSLLGIEHLDAAEILKILKFAQGMNPDKPRPLLKGKRVLLLFYEASTRTRSSFEIAAKLLGAHTVLLQSTGSSIEKGESLLDTGYTVRALGADVIVIRHPNAGAPEVMARHIDVPIINAGDGLHEHPSQALLDAYTILRNKKSLKGLQVAIVGDIFHSRVARSACHLLTKFGARVIFCGPPELVPEVAATLAPRSEGRIRVTRHIEEALRGTDVLMLLRVQSERLAGMKIDLPTYVARYQMTAARLKMANKDCIVMHPGPIIRGLELTSEVADGAQARILEEVRNGVPVRMAILARAIGKM